MSLQTVIDHYIKKQRDLSAVEQFSILHEQAKEPLQAQYYKNLIPVELPGENQQFAFEVDLDLCSGCKACVVACHSLNGLEENEIWREVGFLHGVDEQYNPLVQHVTTACHHCLEPGCMQGCPVKAYEKDPLTGIVHHLDDQCIGCQYCTLMCPYDVPQYSKSKGIVRKCNMCSDRLLAHEAPACVQSCPNGAISIQIVDKDVVMARSQAGEFVAKAPDPQITKPTTHYKRKKPLPATLVSGDWLKDKVQHAHMPLVIMLVLTQLSVGTYLLNWVIKTFFNSGGQLEIMHSFVAFLSGMTAIGASTLHLGRPQYAFRSFLGIFTSWMSREILVFAVFAVFSFLYVFKSLVSVIPMLSDILNGGMLLFYLEKIPIDSIILISGVAGIFCSAMIYHSTKREVWNLKLTTMRFFSSMLLTGSSSVIFSLSIFELMAGSNSLIDTELKTFIFRFLFIIGFSKVVIELALLIKQNVGPVARSVRLQTNFLSDVLFMRYLFAVIGGIILPVAAITLLKNGGTNYGFAIFLLGFLPMLFNLMSDLLDRYIFFAASVPNKMPGGKV
jgi:Fe-S-cluster-containing dehydrogenase component/DMSO reductase anchor subunit